MAAINRCMSRYEVAYHFRAGWSKDELIRQTWASGFFKTRQLARDYVDRAIYADMMDRRRAEFTDVTPKGCACCRRLGIRCAHVRAAGPFD